MPAVDGRLRCLLIGRAMRKLLLTGAAGFLGRRILSHLQQVPQLLITTAGRTRPPQSTSHLHLDLLETSAISVVLNIARPDIIIHAAAIADTAACEREPELALACNTTASVQIAASAANLGSSLVLISTDQVFDGSGSRYAETAPFGPVNVYGKTKVEAEIGVQRALPTAVILRLGLIIGPGTSDRRSASDQVLHTLRDGGSPRLFTDEFRSPIHVDDAARLIVEVGLADRPPPVMHLGGPDRLSRYDLGYSLATAAGLDPMLIRPSTHAEARPWPSRPADVSLDTTLLQTWTRHPPRPVREAVAAC